MLKPKLFSCLKKYDKATLSADLFAGVTVGVVALPLAMAFAIASGVPPERGLFTVIVAGFLISLLGGSRVQIGGPTGAFVVLVSTIMAQHGYEGLVYATIMAGIFLIIMGLGRMGSLIKFIPFPVTTGFTTGIAVVIFSTQIKDLLGLRMPSPPAEFVDKWEAYFHHLGSINPSAAGLSLLTIAVILVVRRIQPRLPSMLFGMVAATLLAHFLHLDVETIGSRFGDLPRMLPSPSFPTFDLVKIKALISPAFTVALLAAIESLLSATVADGMIGGRHRSNMELVAQGVANIGSGIFGGIPATGAIARTATNVKSGGRTPVAGMVHAVVLGLLLLFLAPLAKLIPLAALAGILVVVSYNMSELHHFIALMKAPKSDVSVLLLTFLLTVFIDLTVAVQVGLVLAAVLFIRRMSEISNVEAVTRELGDDRDTNGRIDLDATARHAIPDGVEVYEVMGPFFFGAADKFKEVMRGLVRPSPVVILRMREVPAIDATGLHVLREFLDTCRRKSRTLILSGIGAQPRIALRKSGLWSEVGAQNILSNFDEALIRAHEVLGTEPAACLLARPNGVPNNAPRDAVDGASGEPRP